MSNDEKSRMAYEAREAEIHDQMTRIKTAREEGREEGKIEMAKNLLKLGIDIEKIAVATNLAKDEVYKLAKEKMN